MDHQIKSRPLSTKPRLKQVNLLNSELMDIDPGCWDFEQGVMEMLKKRGIIIDGIVTKSIRRPYEIIKHHDRIVV